MKNKNILEMTGTPGMVLDASEIETHLPCTKMKYWRTAKAPLQHRKISSSKINYLKICGFVSFMLLGLNKETDTAKLSPVKSHKYLISIFSVIFTQTDLQQELLK